MNKIKNLTLGQIFAKWYFLLLLLIPMIMVACGPDSSSPPSGNQGYSSAPTQDDLTNNANRLWAVVGGKLKPIQNSAELANLVERINRTNDPNHTWYVYIFTMDGKLMYYSQIQGKVSSTDSSPSAPNRNQCSGSGSGYACGTVDNPALDGSYGKNEPGIFFFLRNASHTMVETNFYYIVTDSFIPFTQKPVLVQPQN